MVAPASCQKCYDDRQAWCAVHSHACRAQHNMHNRAHAFCRRASADMREVRGAGMTGPQRATEPWQQRDNGSMEGVALQQQGNCAAALPYSIPAEELHAGARRRAHRAS
eukprot:1238780-Pyramimonas_sp.AAC.1